MPLGYFGTTHVNAQTLPKYTDNLNDHFGACFSTPNGGFHGWLQTMSMGFQFVMVGSSAPASLIQRSLFRENGSSGYILKPYSSRHKVPAAPSSPVADSSVAGTPISSRSPPSTTPLAHSPPFSPQDTPLSGSPHALSTRALRSPSARSPKRTRPLDSADRPKRRDLPARTLPKIDANPVVLPQSKETAPAEGRIRTTEDAAGENDKAPAAKALQNKVASSPARLGAPGETGAQKTELLVSVTILGGYQLLQCSGMHGGRGDRLCPFVCVSLHGVSCVRQSRRTDVVRGNGFDPKWNTRFKPYEHINTPCTHTHTHALMHFCSVQVCGSGSRMLVFCL